MTKNTQNTKENQTVCQLIINSEERTQTERQIHSECFLSGSKTFPLDTPDSFHMQIFLYNFFKKLAESDSQSYQHQFAMVSEKCSCGGAKKLDIYFWQNNEGIHERYLQWLHRHWPHSLVVYVYEKRYSIELVMILSGHCRNGVEDFPDD